MFFDSSTLKKPFIIAEVAQAHDGSLGNAHAFIDAAAKAGADAIKFQTHIASCESTYDEPWRVKFSFQDESRFDYWKRMEFSKEQWEGLFQHAQEKNLTFLSSPFSVEAVELLTKIGIKYWKIASGEIYNPEILNAVWETGLPVLYSSGMSTLEDIKTVIQETQNRNIPFGLFQCTTEYPCQPENWGLNIISEFKKSFNCPVGLSDHSGTIYAGLAATALGVDFIEVHVAYSKEMFGPDTKASLTFDELATLVEGTKSIRKAIDNPVDKNIYADKVNSIRKIFSRSLSLNKDLPKGTILEMQHLTLKKPGLGIPFEDMSAIVGKTLKEDKRKEYLLSWEDLE